MLAALPTASAHRSPGTDTGTVSGSGAGEEGGEFETKQPVQIDAATEIEIETETETETRLSLAFFVAPRHDAVLGWGRHRSDTADVKRTATGAGTSTAAATADTAAAATVVTDTLSYTYDEWRRDKIKRSMFALKRAERNGT